MTTRQALGVLRQLERQYAAICHLGGVLTTALTIEEEIVALERRRADLAAHVAAREKESAGQIAAAEQAKASAEEAIARSHAEKDAELARSAEAMRSQIQEWKARVAQARAEHADIVETHQVRLAGLQQEERAARVTLGELKKELGMIRGRLETIKTLGEA